MMQSWLKTGTLRKRCSEQVDNVVDLDSENQEEDVDFNQNHSAEQSREDREPSTSAAAAGKSRPAEATTAGGNEGGSSAKKRRKAPEFTRKYDPNYLKLGFTWCGTESEPLPQCVLCSQTLSNGCMKPAHLKRHLQTKHAKYQDKPLQVRHSLRCYTRL